MTKPAPSRERLVSAARDLFARHGYDAVSVRDITARAHTNLGSITYYFASKQALYHAAIESIAEPFAERVAEASRTPGSPLARIEAVIRAVLGHLIENPGAPTILIRELASGRPLPPPMARLMKRNVGTLAGIIAEGQRDGSIRTGDRALLALSVIAQPFFFRIAERVIAGALDIDERDPKVWARVVDHVVTTARAAIANHPKVVT